MKRDMELIREILLAIEASDHDPQTWIELDFPNHDPTFVSYQVQLLAQATLIEATDLSDDAGSDWRPQSVTWTGHEFLDAARNDTVWKKTLSTIGEKAVSVPFEVLKAALIQGCKTYLGLA